ncbi:MAG: MerR family transcriptional regulator [Deltaproteobacteria bacterium]|nr:MerR family transcriptional regulator [Deltaproteobacteria bacterium]
MATDLRNSNPDPSSDLVDLRDLVDIGEACRLTGLSARTVRYYEELGLLPGVRRRASGRRVYGSDELERLSFIGRLKKLGLTLAEIKELNSVYSIGGSTHDMLQLLDGHLGRHLGELDSRIEELVSLRDEMTRYRNHVGARIDAISCDEGGSS